MSTPLWVSELASYFWDMARCDEGFPRNLRRPIARALPLPIVSLPELGIAGVDRWLRARGIVCGFDVGGRRLRGCLVARRGHGFLFIDGADPDDEQRLSLAHELAHFLRHYWQPRQRVAERLGTAALEVLDGDRAPTHSERVHSLLAHAPIGYYVHLMDRTAEGHWASAAIAAAEQEADRLALELLAPSALVLQRVAGEAPGRMRRAIEGLLMYEFGLPAAAADDYGSLLAPSADPQDSFVRRLGLAT